MTSKARRVEKSAVATGKYLAEAAFPKSEWESAGENSPLAARPIILAGAIAGAIIDEHNSTVAAARPHIQALLDIVNEQAPEAYANDPRVVRAQRFISRLEIAVRPR